MASVIKTTDPVRKISGVPFNLDDVSLRAQSYLEQVREQAAKLVVKAQQEAAAVRSRAEAEGKATAKKIVDQMVEERLELRIQTLMPALRQAIEEINRSRQAWLRNWERAAVELAAAMAARVIRRELSVQPRLSEALVREALELAAGSPDVRLHLNPADREALGAYVTQLAQSCARLAPTEIVADPSVALGGCRVETRFGSIDQSFDAQLARLTEELV